MQLYRKLLIECLLSVGLVTALSQFFLSHTFFLEERLQSISIIALALSILIVLLTFLRYAFLILQAQISDRFQSTNVRSTSFRLPLSYNNLPNILNQFPTEWKLLSSKTKEGYIRFRRPISLRSWGEIIEIQYEVLDEEACWVEIKSSSIDIFSSKKATVNLDNIRMAERILHKAA